MKRCGKSAPRCRRLQWQAKPRVEQDQIGDKRRPAAFGVPGRLLEAVSNGGPRRMVAAPVRRGTKTGLQAAGLQNLA